MERLDKKDATLAMKVLADAWKTMDVKEKGPFYDAARESKIRYEAELRNS